MTEQKLQNIKFDGPHSINRISDLRNRYLGDLYESQELYLELLVQKSDMFIITNQDKEIGYFILGENKILYEYYLVEDFIHFIDTLFQQIVIRFAIEKVYCKSFDFHLLSCCAGYFKHVNVLGFLFRDYKPQKLSWKKLTSRPAVMQDKDYIAAMNEELFESEEEITMVISNRNMLLFEKNKTIIGCGIFQRVIQGRNEFDIGMLVDKKYRKQGYGTFIIQYLTEYCHSKGWRPSCGCDVKNKASRKCLEKAGFITRYRLLEFQR